MKIGVCCQPFGDFYNDILAAKPDYIEVNNSSAFSWSEEELETAKSNIKKNSLPVYSANCMFPGSFRLLGEGAVSREELEYFLERSFSRISSLGAGIAVLGSGGQRRIPEGMPPQEAGKRLADIFRIVGRIAGKYSLTVAAEPLNRKETNVFNTLAETAGFVRGLGIDNIRLLADSYHMAAESEPYSDIEKYRDVLVHAHIAEAKFGSAEIRRTPDISDEFGTSGFIKCLAKAGYGGGVSLECSGRSSDRRADFAGAVEALRLWTGGR